MIVERENVSFKLEGRGEVKKANMKENRKRRDRKDEKMSKYLLVQMLV